MDDHERTIVRDAISHLAEQTRSAQRCVEVLANLFESMRRELYPQQASKIWYVLNQIPNLERVPLYPPDKETNWPSGAEWRVGRVLQPPRDGSWHGSRGRHYEHRN